MIMAELATSTSEVTSNPVGNTNTPVVVESKNTLAQGVVEITLARSDGQPFETWEPGAHAEIILPSGLVRTYSIFSDPLDTDRMSVAVLRSNDSRGGSVEIYDSVNSQDEITLQAVRNNFKHIYGPKAAYIAGGIGITPILSHLRESLKQGEDFQVLYVGRSLARMAFVDDIKMYSQHDNTIIDTLVDDGRSAVKEFLDNLPDSTTVYCCGPEGLLNAVSDHMETKNASDSLVMERFQANENAPDAHQEDDGSFEVELAASNKVIKVSPGETILGQMIESGVDAEFFCEEGYCGTCETKVLEGTPDHRDSVLSKSEREGGKAILPCVSRSFSRTLKLDR